jgi:hypothetical protein
MTPRVRWIVFYDQALFNNSSDLRSADHSVGPQHLLHCVRQKKDFHPGGIAHLPKDILLLLHRHTLPSAATCHNPRFTQGDPELFGTSR